MALRSMTGYGSGSAASGKIKVDAEIRSVNSRFLDLTCRLPQVYSSIESDISKRVRAVLSRGRVEVLVSRTAEADKRTAVAFNRAAFDDLFAAAKDGLTAAGVDWRAHLPQLAFSLLERRDVLETSPAEDCSSAVSAAEAEGELVDKAIEQALSKLIQMRDEEGRVLDAEIKRLLGDLSSAVDIIDSRAADLPATFSDRLKARLAKLPQSGEIDPVRLAQEAAIIADRTDVTEEIARLRSHLGQFTKYLEEPLAGKKIDFLIQELGREFNTVGSKVQNSQIAITVVEAKATLEKIREQIQNVE